ncbi:MAG TPA: ABC transporter permease [Chitinispirillaceae bacterium]|nr:ABC transporter permease [Chitinispirillaceae bacterium]
MSAWPVFLREMMIFAKRLKKPGYVMAMLITPLLYLVTFGLGLGRQINMGESTYLIFIVPGICAMSAMTNSFTGIASSLAVGRLHFKSIEEILVAPISYSSIAFGEIAGGTFRGLFSSLFILLVALVMGAHFPFTVTFFASWILTSIMFAALGVIAGFKSKSHEDTSVFSSFIIMPMSFFCGTFFPVEKLPVFVKWFLQLLPLTHSVTCMRAGYQNQSVSFVHFITLTAFCVLSIWLAIVSIRQSLK